MISNLEIAELREKQLKTFLEKYRIEELNTELDKDLILCVIEADRELGNIHAYRRGWHEGIKWKKNLI